MSVRDAVIVSTARTPIGKAYRGAFNATLGPTLGAFSLKLMPHLIPPIESDRGLWDSLLREFEELGALARKASD